MENTNVKKREKEKLNQGYAFAPAERDMTGAKIFCFRVARTHINESANDIIQWKNHLGGERSGNAARPTHTPRRFRIFGLPDDRANRFQVRAEFSIIPCPDLSNDVIVNGSQVNCFV